MPVSNTFEIIEVARKWYSGDASKIISIDCEFNPNDDAWIVSFDVFIALETESFMIYVDDLNHEVTTFPAI